MPAPWVRCRDLSCRGVRCYWVPIRAVQGTGFTTISPEAGVSWSGGAIETPKHEPQRDLRKDDHCRKDARNGAHLRMIFLRGKLLQRSVDRVRDEHDEQ